MRTCSYGHWVTHGNGLAMPGPRQERHLFFRRENRLENKDQEQECREQGAPCGGRHVCARSHLRLVGPQRSWLLSLRSSTRGTRQPEGATGTQCRLFPRLGVCALLLTIISHGQRPAHHSLISTPAEHLFSFLLVDIWK